MPGPSSTAFLRPLTGSCFKSGTATTQMSITGNGFCCCSHSACIQSPVLCRCGCEERPAVGQTMTSSLQSRNFVMPSVATMTAVSGVLAGQMLSWTLPSLRPTLLVFSWCCPLGDLGEFLADERFLGFAQKLALLRTAQLWKPRPSTLLAAAMPLLLGGHILGRRTPPTPEMKLQAQLLLEYRAGPSRRG